MSWLGRPSPVRGSLLANKCGHCSRTQSAYLICACSRSGQALDRRLDSARWRGGQRGDSTRLSREQLLASDHLTIRKAVSSAANSLAASQGANGLAGFREAQFRQAIRDALEDAGEVCAQEVRPALPGWPNAGGGKLGGFDLAVVGGTSETYRLLAELKWCYVDKLWETLWDAFKVSLASDVEGIEHAYVVVGAPAVVWGKPANGSELFYGGTWSTRELISRYGTNWSWLLAEGSKSQPVSLPELIQTELVANEIIQVTDPAWTIRAITVIPVSSATIELENGWPTEQLADSAALPPEQADTIRLLKEAISARVPENVIAWRYFDSPTLHRNAERLLGVELRDLGFIDVTLAEDVARKHLPGGHPVLAAVLLHEGTLVAPSALINENSQDADLLLAPGTRFRVAHAAWEGELLTVGLEIVS